MGISQGTVETRVTAQNVKDVIDTKLGETEIDLCILTAHVLINDEVAPKGTLSTERLELIELYLSAHFVTLRDRRVASQNLADGSTLSYEGQTGLYLTSSHYGQTAILLDSTGTLKTLQAPRKNASITVVSSA